jgi:NADPH2:quinone reductase
MKAIVVKQFGSPEALALAEVPKPKPGPKQALVRIKAAGFNFIDVYHRTGFYKTDLPFIPGSEAAGVVEEVGSDVSEVAVGDHVAYAMVRGSYAEYAAVPAWQLVKIPDSVDFTIAAAAMLQGMTAHYLMHSTYALKKSDTVLLHAAAGGVGLLIVQMAKMLGARVIGTASTEAKAALAKEFGADEIILYTKDDFEIEVKRLTGQRGVDVVYDSVGQTTFLKGLNCLRPRGMMALFGQSSGPVAPLDPGVLAAKGSLFLTRPSLANYASTREELLWRAGDVLKFIESGALTIRIEKIYRLAEAPQAHRDLEGRKTSGKLLLVPE